MGYERAAPALALLRSACGGSRRPDLADHALIREEPGEGSRSLLIARLIVSPLRRHTGKVREPETCDYQALR